MSNIKGLVGLWSDDSSKIVGKMAQIKSLGFDYVLLRAVHMAGVRFVVDGRLAHLAGEAHGAGLQAHLWGYAYPGNPAAQSSAYAAAMEQCPQATELVLDAESEWEIPGAGPDAEALCHLIAQATGHKLAMHLSSFYAPGLHNTFPFAAFGKHVQSWQPQAYLHGDGQGNNPDVVVARTLKQSVASETLGNELIVTVDDPSQLAQFKGHVAGANAWVWWKDGDDPGVADQPQVWKDAIAAFKS